MRQNVRALSNWEVDEARYVFADQLQYDRVLVHEQSSWTDFLDDMWRRARHMPRRAPRNHNAVTLGNHCFFPTNLRTGSIQQNQPSHPDMGWLLHELTHVWQYQHFGWPYLYQAALVHCLNGSRAYDFGGPDALMRLRSLGKTLQRFNPEQQGSIVRTYYERMCQGHDVSSWMPYIEDIQKPG